MSEEHPVPGENKTPVKARKSGRPITLEQAQAFFESTTQFPCPCCGKSSWTFMLGKGGEEDIRVAIPFYPDISDVNEPKSLGRKIILFECSTCGFMRMHSSVVVSKNMSLEEDEERME